MMTEGVDLTLVIRKANGQLTVSLLPKSNGLKDEAQNHLVPLTVSGHPQELDAGFLQAVARPIQNTTGLISNMAQFEAQAEKAASESKAAKETKAKETKEGKGEAGEVRETFQESGGTDRCQEPQGGGYRTRTGTSLRQTAGPEED